MTDKLRMEATPMDRVLAKVMAICPAAVQNNKIDFERLRMELEDVVDSDIKESYDFTWVGKRKSIIEANTPIRKTLRPVKDESKNWDTTENLYIEGDNLEVLKLLQESYLGKVKMIYIDPPYNTGNDFVYKDVRVQPKEHMENGIGSSDIEGHKMFRISNTEANGRFHSDWCSMMYPRLKLARDFLTSDGVIFISMDDNEVDNLKKLCCEVFGQDNFVGMLSVENNPKGRKNSAFISVSSEYCLIFARDKAKAYFIENVPKKSSDMTMDEDGRFVHNSGKRVLVGENSFNNAVTTETSDKNYSVYFRKKDYSIVLRKEKYGEIEQSLIDEGYEKYYSYYKTKLVENTYTEEKFIELFNERALAFSNGKIYEKNFSDTIRIKSQLVNREYEAIVMGKKKKFSMELTTTGAGTYLKALFKLSDTPFEAPKNTGFLKMLISLLDDKDFCVLDFFSGSASLADAVMQQNASDGGCRNYIMVQLPEATDEKSEAFKSGYKNICEIGKERIRRAGEKIVSEAGLIAQNLDTGFRVLRLDETNMKDVYYTPADFQQSDIPNLINNVKSDRTPLDLLFGVMLEWGLPLSLPIEERKIGENMIYIVGDNDLVTCFDANIPKSSLHEIAKLQPTCAVFRDSSFSRDDTKINVSELFKSIAPDSKIKVI